MEMVYDIAENMISRGEIKLMLLPEAADCVQTRCMQILECIRRIVADESLDDPECFRRIEAIVCTLEQNGIDCGTRHDFG